MRHQRLINRCLRLPFGGPRGVRGELPALWLWCRWFSCSSVPFLVALTCRSEPPRQGDGCAIPAGVARCRPDVPGSNPKGEPGGINGGDPRAARGGAVYAHGSEPGAAGLLRAKRSRRLGGSERQSGQIGAGKRGVRHHARAIARALRAQRAVLLYRKGKGNRGRRWMRT